MFTWQLAVTLMNVGMVLLAIIGFRYGAALLIGVNAKDELDKKDNYAFGVLIGSGLLSLLLVMSGAISGDAQASLQNEFVSILAFGLAGIVMLKIGFLVQDKLVVRGVSLIDEIKNGKMAAAIVSGVNLVAIAMIIRSAIYWSEESTLNALLPVSIVFVCALIILTLVTVIRSTVYAKRNAGKKWVDAIKENNIAIAIRYAGQVIGTAIAVKGVSSLVVYSNTLLLNIAITWLVFGLGVMLLVWIIYKLVTPIILSKINLVEEVDQQGNIGVAFIEAMIFIGIAILTLTYLL